MCMSDPDTSALTYKPVVGLPSMDMGASCKPTVVWSTVETPLQGLRPQLGLGVGVGVPGLVRPGFPGPVRPLGARAALGLYRCCGLGPELRAVI